MTFRRILVTGGAGFIGSHTVDKLLRKGYEVRVLDNLEPQVHGDIAEPPAYYNKDAEFLRGDICDRVALKKALDGCDAVIHDAAMVGVGQSQYQIERYTQVNTLGTAMLLDLIVNNEAKVDRLLVASSMSIYGEGRYRRPSDGAVLSPMLRPDAQLAAKDFEMRDTQSGEALEPVPTDESKPLHSTSIYALSKKDQEEYTLVTGTSHGLSTVACRFFNVYGPRQALSNPYTGACAIFSSRLMNDKPPLIYEDGHQSRDFIDVRDIADAQIFLLENDKAINDVYNVCTGRRTSILQLVDHLRCLHGRESIEPQVVGSFRSGDIRHCFGDPGKLAVLGWKARIPMEEGLAHLVEWTENQEAVDRVDQAHEELVRRGLIRE